MDSLRTTRPALFLQVTLSRVIKFEGRSTTVFWLAGMSIISLLLHLPFFHLAMISDEGGYAYVAQRWLDGRGTLYDDIWVSRPQAIFLAYGAIMHTIGDSIAAIRFGAWLVSIATLMLVWRYAMTLAGKRTAKLATLIFAILSGSPAVEGFTANAEVFMALPAAGAALVLFTASQRGWTRNRLIVVGALIGIATMLKPSGITMLPVAFIFIFAAGGISLAVVAKRSGFVAAGFVAALAPAMFHGYLVGWDNFVFASITYRITHQSSATNTLVHHVDAFLRMLGRTWAIAAAMIVPFAFRWWYDREFDLGRAWAERLSASTRLGFVPALTFRPVASAGAEGMVLLRLWFAGCMLGVAMGGDWWFHYLIQAIAPVSIWMAVTINRTQMRLSPRARHAMFALIVALLLFPYYVLTAGDGRAITREIYGHPGYPDQLPVARYLIRNTPPETPIFIAFDQAALYYLADRPSIYRYLYDQELMALPESQTELIAIIRSPNRPMYIVGTRQVAPFPDRGLAFWRTVARYYHLEATVKGVPIFRANIAPPRQFSPDV